jgi:2-keto-4-pentenoate hydratase
MISPADLQRLATLLADARRDGAKLERIDPDLVPEDAASADAVQDLLLSGAGAIGAYKVLQIADGPGSLGQIPASRILASPAELPAGTAGLRVEAEIAFLIGRDLPGRADGAAYRTEEVAEAIAGAFAAFEILESAFADTVQPPPLLARADNMNNWGLVTSPIVADWQALPLDDVAVTLDVGGRRVVDRRGGHPSGDPFHPMVWLANELVRRGRGFRAGQMVTTGSFGGAHAIRPGEEAVAVIEGFAPIRCRMG